jgi:hypothetical protein
VIAAEAHRNGMRVSGHVPAFMTLQQAVEGGYDEVQHANFWFLNFLFDTVKDTRTPARFTEVAEHAAELDLGSDRVEAFVKVLQEHHTVLDPTVSVFETCSSAATASSRRRSSPRRTACHRRSGGTSSRSASRCRRGRTRNIATRTRSCCDS